MSEAQKTSQATRPAPSPPKPRLLPRWNVVLLDDDDHSYAYVIEMLTALFGVASERGYQMAREVDTRGRVIVHTAHRELAELKCQQIKGYGADVRIARSRGSMSAIIEPVD